MEIKKELIFYFEMYMCAYEEGDPESGMYMEWKSDAHKPLTEEAFNGSLNSFGKVACKFADLDEDKLVVKCISKEEYETQTKDDDKFNTCRLKVSEDDKSYEE